MPHFYNDQTGKLPHKDEKARILSLFPQQLIGDLQGDDPTIGLLRLIEDYYDSLYQTGQVHQVDVETTTLAFTRANEEGTDINIPAIGGNGKI